MQLCQHWCSYTIGKYCPSSVFHKNPLLCHKWIITVCEEVEGEGKWTFWMQTVCSKTRCLEKVYKKQDVYFRIFFLVCCLSFCYPWQSILYVSFAFTLWRFENIRGVFNIGDSELCVHRQEYMCFLHSACWIQLSVFQFIRFLFFFFFFLSNSWPISPFGFSVLIFCSNVFPSLSSYLYRSQSDQSLSWTYIRKSWRAKHLKKRTNLRREGRLTESRISKSFDLMKHRRKPW